VRTSVGRTEAYKAKTGKELEDECLEHVQGEEDRHARVKDELRETMKDHAGAEQEQ
jgi:hypothetical protein